MNLCSWWFLYQALDKDGYSIYIYKGDLNDKGFRVRSKVLDVR